MDGVRDSTVHICALVVLEDRIYKLRREQTQEKEKKRKMRKGEDGVRGLH